MRIKTIKVIGADDAPLIINESDFDKKVHELWPEDKVEVAKPIPVALPDPVEAETPVLEATHKGGGRWIVEVDGKKIHEGTLTKEAAEALVAEQ